MSSSPRSTPPSSLALGLALLCSVALWGGGASGCAGTKGWGHGDGGADKGPTTTDKGWHPQLDGLYRDGPSAKDGPAADAIKPDAPVPADKGVPCAGGCDDGDPCTIDACKNNNCTHAPKNCSDNNGCTTDTCDGASGACKHQPINCDDGNPCTVDACKNNNCVYDKSPEVVYRSVHGNGAHAYHVSQSPPAGFTLESPVWRALAQGGSNLAKVYVQRRSANQDHMLSLSASEGVACCGYQNVWNIGFALTKKIGGAIPVYRLYQASSGLHLSSTNSSEGTANGYVVEGVTFHVCPL